MILGDQDEHWHQHQHVVDVHLDTTIHTVRAAPVLSV
jgi:hypothetical protein